MNHDRAQLYKSKLFTVSATFLLLIGLASAANALTLAANQPVAAADVQQNTLALGQDKVFTYFFVMLGPIKLLAPFVNLTHSADESFRRRLAFRAFLFACIAGLMAAVVGQSILAKWNVSIPALLIAAGIVLFLVALQIVLQQYELPAKEQSPPPTASMAMAFAPLTFPTIITPYGTAALILLLAVGETTKHDFTILVIFLAVMLINLLAMLFAHQLLKFIGVTALRILGAVLGILQVALAIQMILGALVMLGALPPRS